MIKIAELVVTFFYLGKVKFAPGTLGSIVAFPLSLLVYRYLPVYEFYQFNITLLTIAVVLFIVGSFFSQIYMGYYGMHDPGEIIIDEVAGQILTIILVMPLINHITSNSVLMFLVELLRCTVVSVTNYCSICDINYVKEFKNYNLVVLLILSLLFFRLCDIVKPWPVGFIDKNLKNGIGVMLDDIIAGLIAAIMVYIFIKF